MLRYWCDLSEVEIARVRPGRVDGKAGRVMDALERELGGALTRAAESGVPEPVRLRNPAVSGLSRLVGPSRRVRTSGLSGASTRSGAEVPEIEVPGGGRRWAVATAAAGLTLVVVAAVLGPIWSSKQAGHGKPVDPAASSGAPDVSATATPSVDTGTPHGDGKHPLWPLTVPGIPGRTVDQLPQGPAPDVPLPYTLDLRTGPDLASSPTLVTTDGRLEFTDPGMSSIFLLGERPQGIFVVALGTGHDGQDGLFNLRVYLVGRGNSRREVYRTSAASSVDVSPDGTTLAVNTWLGFGSGGSGSAGSGRFRFGRFRRLGGRGAARRRRPRPGRPPAVRPVRAGGLAGRRGAAAARPAEVPYRPGMAGPVDGDLARVGGSRHHVRLDRRG